MAEKSKKATKTKVGRPRKKVPEHEVRLMAFKGHTNVMIARALGIARNTLETNFCAALIEGRDMLENAIRAKQVQKALKGDASMLRWLGVQYCGQKSRSELSGPKGGPIPIELGSPEENEKRLTELLAKAGVTLEPLGS